MSKAVEINPIELLVDLQWAKSNSEARRIIQGGGLRIDNEVHTNIEPFYFTGSEFIMNYGKRRYVRIIIPKMKQYYDDDAGEEWKGSVIGK